MTPANVPCSIGAHDRFVASPTAFSTNLKVDVESMTLFRAWGMGDAMDLAMIRERYSPLALEYELIVRCLGHIEAEWVERFDFQ